MNLKDFKPDISTFNLDEDSRKKSDSPVSASPYHAEINALKIKKLSSRVTFLFLFLFCLIGAILVFGYLDIKERVVHVDTNKQSQVDRLSQQLEEKLNALDVKIAKNRFDFDNNLPEFDKKNTSLEGQIAKLTNSKADAETINAQFEKIAKQVANNANQDKTTLETIERINKQTLLTFEKNKTQLDALALQIKNDILVFKKEMNSRIQSFSSDDPQVDELRKEVSLLDKKYKTLTSESVSKLSLDTQIKELENNLSTRMTTLDNQVKTLNQKLVANILRLQKEIDHLSKGSSSSIKPKPQIDADISRPVKIKEKSLAE